MSYVMPKDFVTKMIDAGEAKVFMATRDTLIRAFMAGAILALAAAFAVTVTVQTGQAIVGALLFPVGFSMLYLLGYDLLTGVVVLTPLALIDGRPGVTLGNVLRNWLLVFLGNFAGALTVAVMMSIVSYTRVDIVARGVIKACVELGHDPAEKIAIFRIPGAWEEEGFKILEAYGVPYADRSVSLNEAARRAATA